MNPHPCPSKVELCCPPETTTWANIEKERAYLSMSTYYTLMDS